MAKGDKLLDIRQFADRTNYSERQIRQFCLDGKIAGAQKLPGGRKWLIPESAILASDKDVLKRIGTRTNKEALESTERIKSALSVISDELTPWLYSYAYELSGKFGSNVIKGNTSSAQFRQDIPLFEDIFGIEVYSGGVPIRGTGKNTDEVLMKPIDVQFLPTHLDRGLKVAKRIESQLRTFPALPNLIGAKAAEVVLISSWIEQAIDQLDTWKIQPSNRHKHLIDISAENIPVRHNLRRLGAKMLDVLIAIDQEIAELESS